MHRMIEPSILYFGTPVVLITTQNEDQTTNIAPMSSVWWLGWSCMLGLDASSQTSANLKRTGECVLNLASADLVSSVDKLAMLTGSKKLPLHKKKLGYSYEPDKFGAAGFSPIASDLVAPPRIAECKIQLEGVVSGIHVFGAQDPKMAVPTKAFEVSIQRVHAAADLQVEGHPNRIDPDKWNPLIMNFRNFYGTSTQLHSSALARGPEEAYAPWKIGGFKGVATRAVLNVASAKFRK